MIRSPVQPRVAPRILCPDLIGREAESAALDELLAEAGRGITKTVLVAGNAGIGKTALLTRFVARARAARARVLVVACAQAESRRAFGPFVDLLRSAGKEISPRVLEQSLRQNAVELFRLLPERAGFSGGATEDSGARERVHQSFTALLADLALRGPLVVVIEDLHWADEASLELFAELARKLRSRPVLIIATYRSDEIDRHHPLRHVVAELERARLVDSFALGPLTAEGSAAVIRTALGWERAAPPEFCALMYTRCEGNPFFIEEVLRALAQRGALIHTAGAWELRDAAGERALPLSVRTAVQDRLTQLSEGARRVLEVAAVIGQSFDFALLQRVTGSAEVDLLRNLHSAVDAQLVVEGYGGDVFSFRHALTRESVLAELLQRERRTMHLAVGETIESMLGPLAAQDAEELAHHFDEAQDAVRALRYRDLAAREATRAAAYSRAMHHLEGAVALAPARSAVLADLELRLAKTALQASDFPRAERAALAARDVCSGLDDQLGVGRALLLLSQHHGHVGDGDGCTRLLQEAVRTLEPLGESDALASAYADEAWLAVMREDTVNAARLAERAVEVARRTRAPALAGALQALGLARMFGGQPDVLEPLRNAVRVALEEGFADTAQRAYIQLLFAMPAAGVPAAERRRMLDEQRAHARRFAVRTPIFITNSIWTATCRGEWDEALSLADELAGTASRLASGAQLRAALIQLARGGPARTVPLVEDLHQRILRSSQPLTRIGALQTVFVLTFAGEFRKALGCAEGLTRELAGDFPGDVILLSEAPLCAILAAIGARDDTALESWIERSLPAAERWPRLPMAIVRRQVAQAERDLRRGEMNASVDALASAARILREEELPLLETLVRLRHAEVLLRRGASADADAAAEELAAVVPFWRRVKATWYIGELRKWARARGVPFPRVAPHPGRKTKRSTSALTSREREVAVLVSEGLTNRQIAEQLVISERTAEGHIEQIRNKLGLRNRALIAVWAAEARA